MIGPMVTTLVLGGTSWVGGQIAQEAVARGHDVTCLARGESGAAPRGAAFVEADRSGPAAYNSVADREWDVVIDVSRQPGQVRSAVAALGAMSRQWTFVSTGSVYVDQSGATTEASPLLPALEGDEAGPETYGAGKVACEQAVLSLQQSLIVRAGLIGGPGDRSDRLGHYVARMAVAEGGPVLVPNAAEQPMQVIDVRDLARWIVLASESGSTGVVHGVGEATTLGKLIDLSAEVAHYSGSEVAADPDWLLAHDIQPWMGPRSLPLWLPTSHHGMGMMDDARSISMGLQRLPLADTLSDTLDDERARGLNRPRSAGLTRTDEVDLIDLWHRDCREPDSAAST